MCAFWHHSDVLESERKEDNQMNRKSVNQTNNNKINPKINDWFNGTTVS